MIFWNGHARPAAPHRWCVYANHLKPDTLTTLPGALAEALPGNHPKSRSSNATSQSLSQIRERVPNNSIAPL
jgi:hypothetical protein